MAINIVHTHELTITLHYLSIEEASVHWNIIRPTMNIKVFASSIYFHITRMVLIK